MKKLSLFKLNYKGLANVIAVAVPDMKMTDVRHRVVAECYSNYCEDHSIPYTEDGLASDESETIIEKIGILTDVNPMYDDLEDFDIIMLHKTKDWN